MTATCFQAGADTWTGNLEGGPDLWTGNTTYSIGGNAWNNLTGAKHYWDKISELKFPLDAPFFSLRGSLQWKQCLELHGTVTANMADPSTKMKDSDWVQSPNSLDVSSESDAALKAWAVDAGLRYWFDFPAKTNRLAYALGVGPSILYQKLDWTMSNLDQWYPSDPWSGNDYVGGKVSTYQAEITMPYLDLCGSLKNGKLSGRLEAGVGPAMVKDEDDHILRMKKSSGDLKGWGVLGSAEIRYDFTKHWFGNIRLSAIKIQGSGTQTQEGYGGKLLGYKSTIDEDFSSTAVAAGLAVGYTF